MQLKDIDFTTRDIINQLVWSTRGNAAAQEAIDMMFRQMDERVNGAAYREAVAVARAHERYKHG